MSILSTSAKLVKVGQDYSAGNGISIDNYVISVTGAVGQNYSAGPNIDIYKEDEQSYISGRDWTDLIKEASANAYDSATGAIPEPQDLTYMSGAINYVSGEVSNASSYSYSQATGYYNTWITGQYEGDITNITNNISDLSSSLSDNYYKKTETSSKGEIDDALQYISANAGKTYEGVSPIVVNNTENKISANTWVLSGGNNVTLVDDDINKVTRIDVTAQGGNPEVETYVQTNSATINDVTSAYQNASATYQPLGNYIPYTASDIQPNTYTTNSALTMNGNQNILYLRPAMVELTTGPISVRKKTSITSGGITAQNITTDDTTFINPNSIVLRDGSANKNALICCSSIDNWDDVSTTYQTNSGTYLTAVDLSNYVPVSSYNELKTSYDALSASFVTVSSLFATYSGQWLLPNTGV